MAEPISFDIGMEVLRGTDAALAMHHRRTQLRLASSPGLWNEPSQDALREQVRRALEHDAT
jgi:hypothetical protein